MKNTFMTSLNDVTNRFAVAIGVRRALVARNGALHLFSRAIPRQPRWRTDRRPVRHCVIQSFIPLSNE